MQISYIEEIKMNTAAYPPPTLATHFFLHLSFFLLICAFDRYIQCLSIHTFIPKIDISGYLMLCYCSHVIKFLMQFKSELNELIMKEAIFLHTRNLHDTKD